MSTMSDPASVTASSAARFDAAELRRWSLIHPIRWVPPGAVELLDVGCNVGAFLAFCRDIWPGLRLAGVDVNAEALEQARASLPAAELHHAGASALPFTDGRFDCVSCIEVLEHVPGADRAAALAEMRRVLRPGGRLLLRTPHAGFFAWLDPHNVRFRFPGFYRRLVGRGRRDAGFTRWHHGVVWHHHFSRSELLGLAGPGWELEACRRGGLLLAPLMEACRWPFYHAGRAGHPLSRLMDRLYAADLALDCGPASYDMLLVLRKTPAAG